MSALLESWPSGTVAVASTTGLRAGSLEHRFALASVTKPLFAYACLVAWEEGTLDLDQPAGPPGATVRHLLAHASGLAPDAPAVLAPPGTRRIYSNAAFDVLGATLAAASGIDAATYLDEAVLQPLGMTGTSLDGSPARAGTSTAIDLLRFVEELLDPQLVSPATLAEATTVQFPGLDGVLPGFGRQHPNDWGLGFEIRDAKTPHWTGTANAPETFGHFGQTGTFLWVDPRAGVGLVCLTDIGFGPWAATAWPRLSDEVLRTAGG